MHMFVYCLLFPSNDQSCHQYIQVPHPVEKIVERLVEIPVEKIIHKEVPYTVVRTVEKVVEVPYEVEVPERVTKLVSFISEMYTQKRQRVEFLGS